MTIAVGVVASDGIVIAADTQITVPSIWKGHQGKIGFAEHWSRTGSAGACLVTGATDLLAYLKNLRVQILQEFNATKDIEDASEMERRFGNILEDFHERHVAPYHAPPQVDLLIAYERGEHGALWATSRSTITPHGGFAAVGAGEPYATALLGRLWRLNAYDIASAVALAVYVVSAVKESVDGCGKLTHVFCLKERQYQRVQQESVDTLERLYNSYSQDFEPPTLGRLFGATFRTAVEPPTFDALASQVAEVVADIRQRAPTARPRRSDPAAQSIPKSPRHGRKGRPPSRA